jgi:hypothetical protein
MTISVEVPAEIARQAAAMGMLAEAAARPALPPAKRLSDEEFPGHIKALAQFSDRIPPLPTPAFSREMIYDDHD